MLIQIVKAEVAGRDSNHRQRVGMSRFNIARRVAYHANCGIGSGHLSRLGCGLGYQLGSDRKMIAESAELEPLAQVRPARF